MAFIALVAIVAFTVAAAAAYFSIYGLILIFPGAVVAVAVMATALEAGKLLATSILYNYWKPLGVLMRLYFIVAIFVLMVITSGGIYGFLSAAYQTNKMPLEQINQRIELLDAEFDRKSARLEQMDEIIASIGANYITKRLEEKEQQRPEREQLTARLNEIEEEKYEIKSQRIETEAHIGPVIYMAEVFNVTADKATNYLILLFIFVFDPLAVALTISVNMLVKHRKDKLVTHKATNSNNELDTKIEVDDSILELSTSEISDSVDGSVELISEVTPEDKSNKPVDNTAHINSLLDDFKTTQDRKLENILNVVIKHSSKDLVSAQQLESAMHGVVKDVQQAINDIKIPEPVESVKVVETTTTNDPDEKAAQRRNVISQMRNKSLS